VKDDLEVALCQDCQRARFVSLAMDGWSDPRGRRYQAVTAQLFDATAFDITSVLLMVKEIKTVHESARELRMILGRVADRYQLAESILNIVTDRDRKNEAALRMSDRTLAGIFDTPPRWLPCTCHLLNNILGRFLDQVHERMAPIFRIQGRFRKCGPFLSYLQQVPGRAGRRTAIPSISEVRWYSSAELLAALLELWPYMLSYMEREHTAMRELNDEVHHDIERLRELIDAFVSAEHELETNALGAGSKFIPHYLGIRARITAFGDVEEEAVGRTMNYMDDLESRYELEWDVFTTMTFLNPSLQWIPGRSCSEGRFARIADAFEVWVDGELRLDGDRQAWFPPAHSTPRHITRRDPQRCDLHRNRSKPTCGDAAQDASSRSRSTGGLLGQSAQLSPVAIKVVALGATSPRSNESSPSPDQSLPTAKWRCSPNP
jgi:hypothetical protein